MQYGACRDRELQSAMNSLYSVECLYVNCIRVLEGIHRMHFLGQDLCADLLACKANDSGLYRIAVRCRQIRDRDLQSAVCVDGSRLAQVRYLVLVFQSDLLGARCGCLPESLPGDP